ncbi:hypothetical protein PROFUN_10146 [Planoprotostelium fungivorum]|uniref:Tify domain-containing protein n=1 Tax=Planoprotostelium fungivorum TaxID=1890364 RepID=A0A2P6NEJ3_9EUKA|nr:hypothetical protein PROFUN_10146 [Planoprotostelium fungivorum]
MRAGYRKKSGTFDGARIICDCCREHFAPTGFVVHCGSNTHKPYQMIMLLDQGVSLHTYRAANMKPPEKRETKASSKHNTDDTIETILYHTGEDSNVQYLVRKRGHPRVSDAWVSSDDIDPSIIETYKLLRDTVATTINTTQTTTPKRRQPTRNHNAKKARTEETRISDSEEEEEAEDIEEEPAEEQEPDQQEEDARDTSMESAHDLFLEFEPPWPMLREMEEAEQRSMMEMQQRDLLTMRGQREHARNLLQRLDAIADNL